MWVMIRFTVQGYEIRAVGNNAGAAEFSGIKVNRTVIMTAMISGGLAGMAGVSETAGLKGYLTLDLSPGFGYTGIAVAMLAQLNPLGVIPAAIFLSAVYVGSDAMSRAINIPTYIADVLVGVSVLAVLCSRHVQPVQSAVSGMSDFIDILLTAGFWAATIRIVSPLIFGTLGELICERAGV